MPLVLGCVYIFFLLGLCVDKNFQSFRLHSNLLKKGRVDVMMSVRTDKHCNYHYLVTVLTSMGAYLVMQLVEAQHYNLECCGFNSRHCHWNFSLMYPSGSTVALGLTQCRIEMSTSRNIFWG
jgi:hypothetical protein